RWRRRRSSWRIKIKPKLKFLNKVGSPKKLFIWLRDAYVRMMVGFANSGGGGMVGVDGGVGGFGRKVVKEYDEKMIIEIYNSVVIVQTRRRESGADGDESRVAQKGSEQGLVGWVPDEKYVSGENLKGRAQFQDAALPSKVPFMVARIFPSDVTSSRSDPRLTTSSDSISIGLPRLQLLHIVEAEEPDTKRVTSSSSSSPTHPLLFNEPNTSDPSPESDPTHQIHPLPTISTTSSSTWANPVSIAFLLLLLLCFQIWSENVTSTRIVVPLPGALPVMDFE
ncbi:hypothetical protein LINPERPRIM_LOCUS28080, partial [Linum perenne]